MKTFWLPIIATLAWLGIGLVNHASAAGDPNRADLLYDPITGEVFLDSLESPGGVLTG